MCPWKIPNQKDLLNWRPFFLPHIKYSIPFHPQLFQTQHLVTQFMRSQVNSSDFLTDIKQRMPVRLTDC